MPWRVARSQARAAAENEGAEDVVDVLAMDDDELQDYVLELFMEADADGNGVLDPSELKSVLSAARLNLSKSEMRTVMAECDTNLDGLLEYKEFLPVMVQVINGLHARKAEREAQEEAEVEREEVAAEMQNYLLHGMRREELEALMRSVFQAADVDGNGTLDRAEFQQCLISAELGLTRREINALMAEADLNDDGKVNFDEFMPLCFEVLVERYTRAAVEAEIKRTADDFQQMLLDGFAAEDPDSNGTLTVKQARHALTKMSRAELGLTKLQVMTLLSEASVNGKGEFNYVEFVPTCARMVDRMLDTVAQEERVEAIEHMARTEGASLLRGFSQDTVMDIMMAAFKEADKDESGFLDRAELNSVLQALGSSNLSLSGNEIAMLMSAVDENEDGMVEYGELVEFMFSALCHLEREAFIQSAATGGTPAEAEEQ